MEDNESFSAECVAEREKRPLYTISCGDLGTEPEQLEVRLKEVFEYAVSWKAILLLDEADIFLQERNMSDLTRNALVTIFLRELEYFDGIIFVSAAIDYNLSLCIDTDQSTANYQPPRRHRRSFRLPNTRNSRPQPARPGRAPAHLGALHPRPRHP